MNISTTVQSDPKSKTSNPKRGRGAPEGNNNAARHGFYSRQNHEANMAFLKENTDLGRADCEILLAAWKVTDVQRRDPSNEPLHVKAVYRFFNVVMRKYGIASKTDEEALEHALAQVERDILFPPEQMAALVKQLV